MNTTKAEFESMRAYDELMSEVDDLDSRLEMRGLQTTICTGDDVEYVFVFRNARGAIVFEGSAKEAASFLKGENDMSERQANEKLREVVRLALGMAELLDPEARLSPVGSDDWTGCCDRIRDLLGAYIASPEAEGADTLTLMCRLAVSIADAKRERDWARAEIPCGGDWDARNEQRLNELRRQIRKNG